MAVVSYKRNFLSATKWSFLVHSRYSTTHNAPFIHPSHDLILELWETFPNGLGRWVGRCVHG